MFNWQKTKVAFKDEWRYHKVSLGYFFLSLVGFGFVAFLGSECIRLKVSLPGYLLSGLLLVVTAAVMLYFSAVASDAMRRDEDKKHLGVKK